MALRKIEKIRSHDAEAADTEQAPAGGGEARLDADVACCLEDIDTALAEYGEDVTEARLRQEKAAAKREWDEIQRIKYLGSAEFGESMRQERIWEAKYAHLVTWCCGIPFFDD
jgi:hypothetical protein